MATQNTVLYSSGIEGSSWGITWDDVALTASALFATCPVAPPGGHLTYWYTLAGVTKVGTWIAPNAVNTHTTVPFSPVIPVTVGITNKYGSGGFSFGFTVHGGGHGAAATQAALLEARKPFEQKWAEHLALMHRIGRVM